MSTLADVDRHPGTRGALIARRAFLSLLALFVVLGATGLLGVHAHTKTSTGHDYSLSVKYAAIARAGLDVPFEITVRHPGGFSDELTLRITGDYFDLFETQGFLPDPAESTRTHDALLLTFTAPEGEEFVLHYDAYIAPSRQQGASATVAVVDHGEVLVSVPLRTVLLP